MSILRSVMTVHRSLILLTAAFTFSLFSQSAAADNWRYGGYNSHYGYSGYRDRGFRSYRPHRYQSRHYSNRFSNRYSHRRYQSNNYFSVALGYGSGWRSHRSNRYHHHNHYNHYHHGNDAAALIGGVVLGSLISNGLSRSSDSYHQSVTSRVVRSSRVSRPLPSVSSTAPRLLRDLQGNCFEIDYDSNGNQRRTQVDDNRCLY